MEHITIIGSGFCGTALAIQLLRNAKRPLRLSLINRSGSLARGLAYGTRSASHILNVPTGNMSLFPDLPHDFLDFARRQIPEAQAASFLPRQLYGAYLQHRLGAAVAAAAPDVCFSSLCQQVVGLVEQGDYLRLTLDNGEEMSSQQVVIATGNFTPATPGSLRLLEGDRRYLRDPWVTGALRQVPADARVLLLGTGLTMYDMALALHDQGHRGPLLAMSRRALLPRAHRFNTSYGTGMTLPETFLHDMPLGERLRRLRLLIRQAEQDGRDWRDVIAALRPLTPQLWDSLDQWERSRFLRHLQPYWDVHRHRAAPVVARRIDEMRDRGQLQVQAGHVMAAEAIASGLVLEIRKRGDEKVSPERFDFLINCTGPCTNLQTANEPLLCGLLDQGMICQDPQGLGLNTDADFRLLDALGNAHPHLSLLSPMLRARYWESTAVPELRKYAWQLAERLLEPII